MNENQKRVCGSCFGDKYLKRRIQKEGIKDRCSYCGKNCKCLLLTEVADFFEHAIREHYQRAPESSEFEWRLDKNPSCVRDLYQIQDLIIELGSTRDDIALDIQQELESRGRRESFEYIDSGVDFNSECCYMPKDVSSGEFGKEWGDFERCLKNESRYFSHKSTQILDKVFKDLEKYHTVHVKPVIVNARPDEQIQNLFRARVFQSRDELLESLKEPEKSLSAPPADKAKPGRMNASGISVFYGSLKDKDAIAEVRPPVGSDVVVAEFIIIRPLRLLDVIALQNLYEFGSVFDVNYIAYRKKLHSCVN